MIGQLLEVAAVVGFEAVRIKQLRESFVPKAVIIAEVQGWVSAGRLNSQLGLTRKDAQLVLAGACQQGLLYQANNGRFYATPRTRPLVEIFPSGAPALYLQDLPSVAPDLSPATNARKGCKGPLLAVVAVVAAIVSLLIFSQNTARQRPPDPAEATMLSSSPVTSAAAFSEPAAVIAKSSDVISTALAVPSQAASAVAHAGQHHHHKHKAAKAVAKPSDRL